jgi:S-adenosylmethionine uptake transporter
MSSRPSSPMMPFLVACLGIAIFSGMDAVLKSLSIALGAYNALLWRSLTGIALIAPLHAIFVRRIPNLHTMMLHIGRGVSGAVSVLFFFWGLVHVPLAQGIALSFVAPLIALGLASMFLKERVGRRAISGSLIAFAGVIVILLGQSGADGKGDTLEGAIAILIAAVLYAVNLVIGRRQSLAAGPIEVALSFNVVAAIIFLFLVPAGTQLYLAAGQPTDAAAVAAQWLPHLPGREHWPTILLASVIGTSAIMLLAWSYARAEAQILVSVEYTAFVWAVLLGWWVFGETVLPTTWLGAAMIIAGCLWAARQQPGVPHATIEPEAA